MDFFDWFMLELMHGVKPCGSGALNHVGGASNNTQCDTVRDDPS